MKFALYDLSTRSTSFDFLIFCIIVKSECAALGEDCYILFKKGPNKGFSEINTNPYSEEEKQFRLTHILYPICAMMGLDYATDINSELPDDILTHENRLSLKDIIDQHNKTPLVFPKPSNKAMGIVEKEFPENPVVITLREIYSEGRNSDLPQWLKFADYVNGTNKVVFIRDTEKWNDKLEGFDTFPLASIDLDIRLALFRHANINFAVGGGGTTLLNLSNDIPYRMFKYMRKDDKPKEANMKLIKSVEELKNAAKDKKDYAIVDPKWLHEQLDKGYTKLSFPTISGGTTMVKFNRDKAQQVAASKESLGEFTVGSQFPWNTENQRIVWKDDNFDNLKEEYDKWLKNNI